MISFKRLLKTVPGGDKIVKQLEKKNLKELAKNKTVRQQLANVFKDYGKALTTETTTEMLQETSNIVAGFTARKIGGIEDDSLPDYLKKNSARVLETGIATFGATMFLGGFGTTAKTATILTKQGMTKNQAQKTAESMSLEEKKQLISENMDTLMQTVKDIPSVQELEKREQLHENIKNDMVSGVNIEGIDDITLNDTARVFSESIANLAKTVGKNVDEVNRLFNIKYETLTDEQAIKQYRRDNTLLNGSVEKNVVRNQENIKDSAEFTPEVRKNIESNFGQSIEDITEMVKSDIKNIIEENNLSEDEFKIVDARMYGSFSTGRNKKDSDLDFLVEYTGNMREDDLFNMFHDAGLEITDNKGNQVKIDINPTKAEKSGTIAQHLSYKNNNLSVYPQDTIISFKDDINQRTDKSRYLTDNEVENLKKDSENFKNRINDFLNKKLSIKSRITVLSKLPSAYNKIPDLKGKKVVINQSVYAKIIDLPNKHNKNHNVDRKRAIKLPEFISDPLYILQSSSKGNEHRYIVVTSSKNNKPKQRLSIILHPGSDVAIVSAYDEVININEEKKNNRVLYDKKVELSKTFATSKAAMIDNSSNIISNTDADFNPNVKNDIYFQSAYHGTPHRFDEIYKSKLYNNLPQDLKEAIDFIYNGESVYNVTGEEFPNNGGNFTNLIDRITDFYKKNFNSKIEIKNFGEILLDKKSVKNSSYHNFNTNKINAFAAVPYVLKNGKIANYQEKYKGRNEDRYLFVAPITVNGEEYFCEVVVKATDKYADSGVKRFYLHEIELKKKLADVFLTSLGGTSTSSKSIIADLIDKLNPNVIKRYYQELDNEDYNLKTTEESIKNARGFTYQKTNFDGSIKENVIVLLKGKADKSTLLHEFSHIYLNVLNVLAKDNDKAKDMLLTINKQLRYDGKEYTTQQHEKFAKMFEVRRLV